MSLIPWPVLLKPNGGGFSNSVRSLSGGRATNGIEQVVSQMHDRWQARYRFRINSTATLEAARAFILAMRGRANTVELPVFEARGRAPWAIDPNGQVIKPSTVRYRGLEGTDFASSPTLADDLVQAQLAFDAPLNALSVRISMFEGGDPRAGHHFSLGSRLHAITTVQGSAPYLCGVWPWMRADYAAGAAVNFTSPKCLMRFQTDDQGSEVLQSLDQFKFGDFTLAFDEAL